MSGRIPWARLTAEGFAIVVSILLAFAIDAAWSARTTAREDLEVLQALRDEVVENIQIVSGTMARIDSLRKASSPHSSKRRRNNSPPSMPIQRWRWPGPWGP